MHDNNFVYPFLKIPIELTVPIFNHALKSDILEDRDDWRSNADFILQNPVSNHHRQLTLSQCGVHNCILLDCDIRCNAQRSVESVYSSQQGSRVRRVHDVFR
jgi:hypothetical protein